MYRVFGEFIYSIPNADAFYGEQHVVSAIDDEQFIPFDLLVVSQPSLHIFLV